jgi:hypothetical protein
MCFSATASITSAAMLIPAGMYCLKESNRLDKRYWAFAILPLMFGLQQLLEGSIWLALTHDYEVFAHSLALGFLLFSHVFWLGWIAFSSYLTESFARSRQFFLMIAFAGLIFGALMYVPLLLNPEWLSVSIARHSIRYELVFLSDAYVSQYVIATIYVGIILIPLMLSSDRYHRMLGIMILFSGIITTVFYGFAFISVWCYFAAIISLYIFLVTARNIHAASKLVRIRNKIR